MHRMDLGVGEIVAVEGIRVTTVVRTMADLLRAGPRDDALVAVESAVNWRPSQEAARCRRRPLTTLDKVREALASGVGMWGTKRAVEWLGLADPGAGSPVETLARLWMRDAGLVPETQVRFVTPSGRTVYVDFFFRGRGLVVEIEGYAWHGSRAQHQRDTVRYNDLADCPEVRKILRFTAADVLHRPAVMVRRVQAALG
ncbi:hypothetical protein [Streptomyces sp. AV19]|uniref:hypothetical protein n=1 Tax=Streptomyces sp. AV19 TaxID=2793068 RepID=UPI001F184465|nr:hypothetical protein [Streptomyces sp. AV19]MDG4535854.1 hypothetical protein [Streptomyces sp. AV19]